MTPDLDRVEALMREAANLLILPRWRSLSAGDIDEKAGPQDLVTIADREAEEWLVPRLEELVPGSRVVGEEGVSQGLVSADILKEDGPRWLVDPVDGTYNFVQGSERFGVMVAYCERQEVRAAWVLYPASGEMLRAEKGGGAYLGDVRLAQPPRKSWAEATGDYSHMYVEEPYRTTFLQATERSGEVRRGRCSAYAYGDTARGLIDYVVQYQMTPWDHAPGQLIVEEAGGRFGFLPDGEAYTPVMRNGRPMLCVAHADSFDDYARELGL